MLNLNILSFHNMSKSNASNNGYVIYLSKIIGYIIYLCPFLKNLEAWLLCTSGEESGVMKINDSKER